ncbi:hypothetical protein HDV01_006840 [Terramyces sp. JEL0728]|nr:hypothetical protein HDV01_006840 [Terramyces sp. JEL0728]
MQTEKPCNVCTDFRKLRKKNKKLLKEEVPCPLDKTTLGNYTWGFLHTMAAYYPQTPSKSDQQIMKNFITGLSRFYPCSYCAEHLQKEIVTNPPDVKNNYTLSMWFCNVHNEVNERLGKPTFDCSRVFERWKDGNKNCFE